MSPCPPCWVRSPAPTTASSTSDRSRCTPTVCCSRSACSWRRGSPSGAGWRVASTARCSTRWRCGSSSAGSSAPACTTSSATTSCSPTTGCGHSIGSWGNYFNQELFGGPTKLPWGLEISPANRPPGYLQDATFHPTFLYESLYCLFLLGVVLWVERRFRLRKGQMLALYLATYTFGRFFFENMRIDPANEIFGVRLNAWVSAIVCIASIAWFVWLGRRGGEYRPGTVPADHDVPATADDAPDAPDASDRSTAPRG